MGLKKQIIRLSFILISLILISGDKLIAVKNKPLNIQAFYDSLGVEGCLVIYDEIGRTYYTHNVFDNYQAVIPASTFKIVNTLIALDLGIVKDEYSKLAWDSVVRDNPSWNMDQDLQSAYRNSTVWYCQELARRIGEKNMNSYLKRMSYGNMTISGGIDRFWLDGGLRISPMQQVDFLSRLHAEKLGLNKNTYPIAKKIMLADSQSAYQVYAKTGWGEVNNRNYGWYVGYVETKDKVLYFAHCIQSEGTAPIHFKTARKDLVYLALKQIKIIP